MTDNNAADSALGRRLDGWKDIATHLARGVRTVQRWEKDYGLPVRRHGQGKSEAVFAFERELADWLVTSEADDAQSSSPGDPTEHVTPPAGADAAPPPSVPQAVVGPARRAIRPLHWLLFVVLVFAAGTAWWAWPHGPATPGTGTMRPEAPAKIRVDLDSLVVTTDSGKELWRHSFGHPIGAVPNNGLLQLPNAAVRDFDGNGGREVLFVDNSVDRTQPRMLYCFEADGRVRWTARYQGTVRFGGTHYSEPFDTFGFTVTPDPRDATRLAIWLVSTDHTMFPSVLQRLDPRSGSPMSEYWSNGYMTSVVLGAFDGKPALFIGANNNETSGASLAVLDALNPNGSAPSAKDKYRCQSCGSGNPMAFVVFPKPDRFAMPDTSSSVESIHRQSSGELSVRVVHADATTAQTLKAVGIYRLDSRLRPLAADVASGYSQTYRVMRQRSLLPGQAVPEGDPERDLLPILRWNGTGYMPVSKVAQDR